MVLLCLSSEEKKSINIIQLNTKSARYLVKLSGQTKLIWEMLKTLSF